MKLQITMILQLGNNKSLNVTRILGEKTIAILHENIASKFSKSHLHMHAQAFNQTLVSS